MPGTPQSEPGRPGTRLVGAAQCEGREVTSIEGLATDGRLHLVQEAFAAMTVFSAATARPGRSCRRSRCCKRDERVRMRRSAEVASTRAWGCGASRGAC